MLRDVARPRERKDKKMPEIEITGEVTLYPDIHVWCDTCGDGLFHTVTVKHNELYVPACETCMKNERENAEAQNA